MAIKHNIYAIILMPCVLFASQASAIDCSITGFDRQDTTTAPTTAPTTGTYVGGGVVVVHSQPAETERCAQIAIRCDRSGDKLIHASEFYARLADGETRDGRGISQSERLQGGESAEFFTCFGPSNSPISAIGYQTYP